MIAAALLIGACGGTTKNPGVANVNTTTTGSSTSSAQSTDNGALGGDQGPSTSSGGPAPSSGQRSSFAIGGGSRQNALKLSACMRANGAPSFPDPNANGVIQGNFDPNTPQFEAAMKKCRKYTPNGGKPPSAAQQEKAFEQALKFSQCMRAHGVSQFPDPQELGGGGGVRISIHSSKGSSTFDPNSPIFKHAQNVCGSLIPGRNGPVTSSSRA